MSESRTCPTCQREIPADSPSGACPHCAPRAGIVDDESAPTLLDPRPRKTPAEELAAHFPELDEFRLIGPGGMGTVYRARQRELGRPVAVKVMHAHLAEDPSFAERFAREARTLARLDHPNIVRVYDGGHRSGLAYLVMELVEGVTLRQAMQAGSLTPKQALALVPRICDALQYAHEQGVVHRDIKPENILLDRSGSPKVADFGLAKLVGPAETRLTLDRQVMGTPHYMAPEQLEHPDLVDHRADIYALGVVFYEMLTGELPVGRFPPPSEKVEVDERLDRVILRTLEKEPSRRYQHASELGSEVEKLSEQGDDESPRATAPGRAGSATPAPARRPSLPSLAVLAFAVLAVAAGLYFWRTSASRAPAGPPAAPGPPLTAIAVLPFADMSPEGDQQWLANGMAEELIESVSRSEQIRVIARTSAFALRGEEVRAIGERLGVGAVIEGSVRRSGDDLRVTAQLVRTADGSRLWSARYDRRLDDVFEVQSQIARDVAEAIRRELGIEEELLYGDMALGRYVPRDVGAYELLRKGIETGTFALTREALLEGSEQYRRALEIDPDYADAHAMLGMHHGLLWLIGYDPSDERRASAAAAARRALELEEWNPTAHQVLALLSFHQGEYGAAEERLERALAAHPQGGGLRMRYAEVLAATGRLEQAVGHARRAVELDPLAPVRHFELGHVYLLAGRYDDAVAALERSLELNPQQLGAGAYLSSAYHLAGRDAEALEAAVADLPERSRGLEPPMRQGFAAGGYEGMVRALNETLVAVTGNPCGFEPGLSAGFYAITGDAEAMYGCLEAALAAGRAAGLYLKVHPTWEPYRGQPRFRELLRRAGLEP